MKADSFQISAAFITIAGSSDTVLNLKFIQDRKCGYMTAFS